jgi:transposase
MKRLVLDNKNDVISQIRSYLEMNSEAKFIHRLQVILLFANTENGSCDGVSEIFGNSPRSVSNWIKKINRTGKIESLRSKPQPGMPSRLSQAQKAEIKAALMEKPEKWGLSGRKWNGKNLSNYVKQYCGITLEVRSCQRLLRELGLRANVSSKDEKSGKTASKPCV